MKKLNDTTRIGLLEKAVKGMESFSRTVAMQLSGVLQALNGTQDDQKKLVKRGLLTKVREISGLIIESSVRDYIYFQVVGELGKRVNLLHILLLNQLDVVPLTSKAKVDLLSLLVRTDNEEASPMFFNAEALLHQKYEMYHATRIMCDFLHSFHKEENKVVPIKAGIDINKANKKGTQKRPESRFEFSNLKGGVIPHDKSVQNRSKEKDRGQ